MSFTNDMSHPIVIRSFRYRSGGRGWVRYEIWGIPEGRKVSLSKPSVSNVRKAITRNVYVANLRHGQREQIEFPGQWHGRGGHPDGAGRQRPRHAPRDLSDALHALERVGQYRPLSCHGATLVPWCRRAASRPSGTTQAPACDTARHVLGSCCECRRWAAPAR